MTGTSEKDEAERLRDGEARLARLPAIAAELRAKMTPDARSGHDWLYDQRTGLPK